MTTSTLSLTFLRDAGLIHSSWASALVPVQSVLDALAEFLETEARAGFRVLPDSPNIMRAFRLPVDDVRVLVVGQDPYPTPRQGIGLAFAVDARARVLPRSLNNIFTEVETDTGSARPGNGDLRGWTEQGVMLLNRVLTVRAGEAGSHRAQGWEAVTDRAIDVLVQRNAPLVAVLWGKQAAAVRPLLAETATIETTHPSPLSARRGFFGSRPFSRTNELLEEQGSPTIDWARVVPETGPDAVPLY